MNLIEKAANSLGRLRAAYDAPLLKAMGVDGLGRTLPLNGSSQLVGTAGASWLGTGGGDLTANGYTNHGTAYSIISYILDVGATLPWGVYRVDKKDNRAEPIVAGPLFELLYRPNPLQSWADFATQCKGGHAVNGQCFIRRVRPAAGTRKGKTTELWCLVGRVDLLPLVGLGEFDKPTGYRHYDALTGAITDYPADDILHLKRYNPLNPHLGLSPIAAGIDAITASKAGLTSRVRQYNNQGPAGVIFDKKADEPWSTSQTQNVRNWLRSYSSGGRNFGEVPITGGELGYLSLGISPVDLDLLAAIPYDKDAVADLFHFPGQLLNGSKGTTFNNMNEASKALYTRCVLPLERMLRDGLNRWLGPEYDDGQYLDYDTSQIAELQEDKKAQADYLAAAWWIPVKLKQTMSGVPATWTGPEYVLPSTYVSATDLGDLPVPADAANADGLDS